MTMRIPAVRCIAPLGRSLILVVLLLGAGGNAFTQDRFAVDRAQAAVREKILQERGGNFVTFPEYPRAETYVVSNWQTGVRGQGTYTRDTYSRPRSFTYDAVVNRNGRVDRITYQFDTEGGGGNAPSWLVGSFRGRDPVSGRRVTVTIQTTSEVLAAYDGGRQESGRLYGNTIRFGSGPVWELNQLGDGFRARSDSRSETFGRTSGGGGGSCAVPTWTVGRFRGTTRNGEAELTINSDGSATARSLRANRTFPGRYADGILTFEFGSYSIAREGDGIRTIAVNNSSEQTTYVRF